MDLLSVLDQVWYEGGPLYERDVDEAFSTGSIFHIFTDNDHLWFDATSTSVVRQSIGSKIVGGGFGLQDCLLLILHSTSSKCGSMDPLFLRRCVAVASDLYMSGISALANYCHRLLRGIL